MKLILMGRSERAAHCLAELVKSEHEVVLVVAQEGEEGWFRSIVPDAKEYGIPVIENINVNTDDFIGIVKKTTADLIVMICFSQLVRKKLRETPRYGIINLHAGHVPYYKGDAPLNWALINGEENIRISILQVDKGIDTGDVLADASYIAHRDTTIKDLCDWTLREYPEMLIRVLDLMERGMIQRRPQNSQINGEATWTHRGPKDGMINWRTMTAMQIHNLVRALTHPYPGAFFFSHKLPGKFYVWETKLLYCTYRGVPGRIATFIGDSMVVICKDRGLLIKTIQHDTTTELGVECVPREIFHKTGADLL